MIRHISLFRFLDAPANGRTKAENISEIQAYLEKIPAMLPTIVRSYVGPALPGAPDLPDEAPVQFADLAQVIDFKTPEDAAAYPASQAHQDLAALSGPMMKKVIAIDFEI